MYTVNTAPEKTASEELNLLFDKYRQKKENSVRNEIVMRSMHIVKYAVLSTRNMFRGYADEDDIYNEAVLALMSSVDTFDTDKNVKFDTYASIKVRGAIIDYIRREDSTPRSVRRFAKDYDKAFSELYTELNREPTREEIAGRLGITVDKLDSFAARSAASHTLSFEELVFDGFDPAAETEDGCYEAEKRLMEDEKRQQLAAAVRQLKDKERTVVTLYYYEKLKYSEIAAVMDVSESRVCQIHSRAMDKMKKLLSGYILESR